jgi:RNA polymerase sigma-70 factor (ECF subfamily)
MGSDGAPSAPFGRGRCAAPRFPADWCNPERSRPVRAAVSEILALSGAAEAREPLEERLVGELPSLRAFLARLSGSARRGEVDDLVQETLARVLRLGRSYDPERPLGPWLRATALRVLIDQRRAPGTVPLDAEVEERALPDGLEGREGVERLLAALDGVERDVLARFHVRGEPIAAIAAELGLPEGTVKSHLHRARRKLAERFGARERT